MTPAHPERSRLLVPLLSAAIACLASATDLPLHSIGDWSPEEQYQLELINRARSNPSQEGARLAGTADAEVLAAINSFRVDLAMLRSEFNAIPPAPPLAPNAQLLSIARLHSADMLRNSFQGHVGSDGATLGTRAQRGSYAFRAVGENVFSYARSGWHAHAGFQIDWGEGPGVTGGMQPGRGHRTAIHSTAYNEVGIGWLVGSSGTVGPNLVTQNFGTQSNPNFRAYATGVVYQDVDANGFYTPGEGIPGVEVRVAGAGLRAITGRAGGWAIPIAADGTHAVTFRDADGAGATPPLGAQTSAAAVIENGRSAKIDVVLPYAPAAPTVAGSALSVQRIWGFPNLRARLWRRLDAPRVDAEGSAGLSEVILSVTAGYNPVQSAVVESGTASYRLAHPRSETQILELAREFFGSASSRILFNSRLGFASGTETARVQISVEGGSWRDLSLQAGSGGMTEAGFSERNIGIAAVDGRRFRIRFLYENLGGSYFLPESQPGGSALAGWFIDSIRLVSTEALDSLPSVELGTALSFVPVVPVAGEHLVAVEPGGSTTGLPPGATLQVRLPLAGGPTSPVAAILAGEVDLGAGWRRTSWFGSYYVNTPPWIHHEHLGWLYPGNETSGGRLFHDPTLGWFWVSPTTHPWIWSYSRSSWLYHQPTATSGRVFYDAGRGRWEIIR